MRSLYIAVGFTSLILGLIGIPTPGLPTTPFLLITLFCFGKSSPRLQKWFMDTSVYQKHLKTYDEARAMTIKQKITILLISTPFTLFALFFLPNIWGKLALMTVIIIQYWYFFCRIKTID